MPTIAQAIDSIRRSQPAATKPLSARVAQLGVFLQNVRGRAPSLPVAPTQTTAPSIAHQGFSTGGAQRAPHPQGVPTINAINRGFDTIQAPLRVNP